MATRQSTTKKRKGGPAAGARKAKLPKRKTAARPAGRPERKPRPKALGRSGAGGLQRLFPKVLSPKAGPGQGAFLAVALRSETGLEVRSVAFEQVIGVAGGQKRKRAGAICPNLNETARLLRGLAHAQRLHILDVLRQGARKHIELKAAVQLAAGPLYHHLRELERCGLIECPCRNDYVLTGTGRSALLLVSGLNALTAKSRRIGPWKAQSFQKRLTKSGQPKQSRPRRRR